MSRKKRERARADAQKRHRRNGAAIGALAIALVLLGFLAFRPANEPKDVRADGIPRPTDSSSHVPASGAAVSYLQSGLPEDDVLAKKMIHQEYFNFDGFTIFQRESDIPLETLLVPDTTFNEQELSIILRCVSFIGAADGEDSPVFLALKDWAERKEGRLIKEIVPLDRKIALRNGNYTFAIDAFWSGEMGMIYMGRHQLPYLNLFISTLYQEAYHAVQLRGRKITPETNVEIELEAHEAQLRFNEKLSAVVSQSKEHGRRFRLEIEVINENLRDAIAAYRKDLIRRSGIELQKK